MPWELSSRWFIFRARGHPNVRATHRSTLEVTREDHLTPRGDCIIGVSSEVAPANFPEWLRDYLRSSRPVVVVLCSGGVCDALVGWGDPRLQLTDDKRMVFRRSDYIGPETVVVKASKAARDLDRRLIENLKAGMELLVAIAPLHLPQSSKAPLVG